MNKIHSIQLDLIGEEQWQLIDLKIFPHYHNNIHRNDPLLNLNKDENIDLKENRGRDFVEREKSIDNEDDDDTNSRGCGWW